MRINFTCSLFVSVVILFLPGCSVDTDPNTGWRLVDETAASDSDHSAADAAPDSGPLADAPEPFAEQVVPVAIAAGDGTCVSYSNGRVKCAGDNRSGAFGAHVARGTVSEPVILAGVEAVFELDAYSGHWCAAVDEGRVICWGDNSLYQLTDAAPADAGMTPTALPGLENIAQIATGAGFSCARSHYGEVFCWGDNSRGQIGNGLGGEGGEQEVSPQSARVPGLTDAVKLFAGGGHVCVRSRERFSDAEVVCWGDRWLGYDVSDYGGDSVPMAEPVVFEDWVDAQRMCMGQTFACGLKAPDGAVHCWGLNINGALSGNEWDQDEFFSGTEIRRGATDLTCGAYFACARESSGEVTCWGFNSHGQLGRSDMSDGFRGPVEGLEHEQVVDIEAGTDHACALLDDGRVKCWGRNDHGQLGDGTTEDQWSAVETLW